MGSEKCKENKNWKENQKNISNKWKKYRKEKEESYYKNPKLCKYCDGIIKYSKDMRYKTFCSSSCSASYNNPMKIKKERPNCLNCDNKVKEGSKKYCSKKCMQIYKCRVYIEKWKSGEISGGCGDSISPNIRKYIFEKYDSKCTKCGWSEINKNTGLIPLHVDHIDGDSTNNVEENLDLLCPSCHSLTPNYGSLNKGNSKREYRNKWRKKYKETMDA